MIEIKFPADKIRTGTHFMHVNPLLVEKFDRAGLDYWSAMSWGQKAGREGLAMTYHVDQFSGYAVWRFYKDGEKIPAMTVEAPDEHDDEDDEL